MTVNGLGNETPSVSEDDERIIRELEHQRFAAVLASDFGRFASYCHPDLVYTHSNASVDSLGSYLKKCQDGFYVYHSIDHPIDRVMVFGNTALVVGEMRADLTAGGVRKQLDNTSLAVWLKVQDDWKLVAYQPTVKAG